MERAVLSGRTLRIKIMHLLVFAMLVILFITSHSDGNVSVCVFLYIRQVFHLER